jgi:hypothetical protein
MTPMTVTRASPIAPSLVRVVLSAFSRWQSADFSTQHSPPGTDIEAQHQTGPFVVVHG